MYAKGNPLYWADMTGLKDIIVIDEGWGGTPTENMASFYVPKPKGGYWGPFKGSTFPDNPKECATVSSGQYPFVVFKHPTKGVVPLLKGNLPIMTLKNPNSGSSSARGYTPAGTANEILVHRGYNKPGKGSCGCATINGPSFNEFSDLFEPGETGTITIIRPNLDTNG